MLNCKPGQNAIVIGGTLNLGRIFRTDCLLNDGDFFYSECGNYFIILKMGMWHAFNNDHRLISVATPTLDSPLWRIEDYANWQITTLEQTVLPVRLPVMMDGRMKPLLDIEGDDEMIVIAGKPVYERDTEPA